MGVLRALKARGNEALMDARNLLNLVPHLHVAHVSRYEALSVEKACLLAVEWVGEVRQEDRVAPEIPDDFFVQVLEDDVVRLVVGRNGIVLNLRLAFILLRVFAPLHLTE